MQKEEKRREERDENILKAKKEALKFKKISSRNARKRIRSKKDSCNE